MSLDLCKKDNLYCNMTHSRYFTKIIYNKIDDKHNFNHSIQELNNIYDELSTNLDDDIKINQYFDRLYNLYRKPSNIKQFKLVFTGIFSKEIEVELDKISRQKNYEGVNLDLLYTYFNFNSIDEFTQNIGSLDYEEILFVDFFINKHENINMLYSIIYYYINKKNIDICDKDGLYVYGDFLNLELLINKLKQSILLDYKKDSLKYNITILKNKFIGLGIPQHIVKNILDKWNNDITNINNILNEKQVYKFFEKHFKFLNLGYNYINNDKTNYNLDSYIFNYYNESSEVFVNARTDKLILDDNKLYTLEYYPESNNSYYFYNVKNIMNNLVNQNIINSSDISKESLQKINLHFIKKLFPFLTLDKLIELYSLNILHGKYEEEFNSLESMMGKYNIISSVFNKYSEKNNKLNINYQNNYLIKIKHKISLPENLDIRDIFNELKLSENIPFVKFRDMNANKLIVYKLYKPLTSKKAYNYEPKLTKEVLLNWIKYKGIEFNEGDISYIRNVPKEISYKVKVADINYKKLTGIIELINDDKIDILHNNYVIEDIPIQNVLSKDIKIGNEVEFYSQKSIYADIDISKKGMINILIDTHEIKEHNLLKNLSSIIEQINNFINNLYLIETLQSYRVFDNSINIDDINHLSCNNLSNISNIIYNYKLSLPEGIKVSYDGLYNLSRLLYPYVLINESPYNIDDEIQFFDDTKLEWVDGKITKYSYKNTYDIGLYNEDRSLINKELSDIEGIMIRKQQTDSTKNMFELIFKKIPEFNQSSPIKNMILKLNNSGLSENEILERIMDNFNLSRDDAFRLMYGALNITGNDTAQNLIEKLDSEIGISIKIDYIQQLVLDTNNINIFIENIKSVEQIYSIYRFINFFFNLYLQFQQVEEKYKIDILNDLVEFNSKNNTKHLLNEAENIKKIVDIDKQSLVDIEKVELDTVEFTGDLDFGSDSDDEEESEEDEKSVKDEEHEEIEEDLLTQSSYDQEKHIKKLNLEISKSKTQTFGAQTRNPILAKLYDNDPELFPRNITDKYARQCQGLRIPHILNDKEIELVDILSYSTTTRDIKCKKTNTLDSQYNEYRKKTQNILGNHDGVNILEKEKPSEKNVKCSAILYGTTPENSKWYICPKIIDLIENKPLRVADLDFSPPSGFPPTFTPVNEFIPEDRVHGDKKMCEFFDQTGKKHTILCVDAWRTDKNNGKDILEFNPKTKITGRIPVTDLSKITPKESLFFRSKNESRSYPGFLASTGTENPVPCCFRRFSKNLGNVLQKNELEKSANISSKGYVQGWGRELPAKRLGLLPGVMYNFFGISKEEIPVTGDIDQSKNKNWFLRRGINQNYNSFFSLIAEFYDKDYTDQHIVDRIVKNLTISQFKKLNKGNLFIEFKNLGKQSSFQNFLEYTISNQYKNYKFYYELLTNTPGILFDNSIILFIFEYKYENGIESIKLLCPYFTNKEYNIPKDKNINVFFALKRGSHFEPIYLFNKGQSNIQDDLKYIGTSSKNFKLIKNILETFEIECNEKSDSQLINVAKQYGNIIYRNIIDIKTFISILDKISIQNNDYKPLALVKDNYNKYVGILLKNSIIIPVYPQNLSKDLGYPLTELSNYGETDIKIDQTVITKLGFKKYLDVYNDINNILKKDSFDITIEIVKIFLDENNIVSGFVSNVGVYIPVKSEELSSVAGPYDSTTINYNDVDKSIEKYENKYSELIYKTPLSLNAVVHIMEKIKKIDTNYEIIAFYTNNNKTSNLLILKNNIFIPIKEISIEDLSTLKQVNSVKIINLFEEYLPRSISLARLTNYKLPLLPVRLLMTNLETKEYTSVIIETGLELRLDKHFNINTKDSKNKYKILKLIEEPIIEHIYDEKKIDGSLIIDERIKQTKKIKYVNDIYEVIKLELYLFFQNPKNKDVKQYFIKILNNLSLLSNTKKIILYPIFNLIMDSICQPKYIITEDYPSIDIEQTCNNSDCRLDNCQSTLVNASFKNISNTREFIEIIYSKNIDKIIENLSIIETNNINESLKIYNTLVNNLNKLKTLCKTEIVENIEKTRIYTFKNKLIEELIRNRYKRNQIFYVFKRHISAERYKAHIPYETIITSEEITANIINDLYKKLTQKYYNDFIPFDETNLEIETDLDRVLKNRNRKCYINKDFIDKYKDYSIKFINSNFKLLNNNVEFDNTIKLKSNLYKAFENKIYSLNVKLDSCKVGKTLLNKFIKIIPETTKSLK